MDQLAQGSAPPTNQDTASLLLDPKEEMKANFTKLIRVYSTFAGEQIVTFSGPSKNIVSRRWHLSDKSFDKSIEFNLL